MQFRIFYRGGPPKSRYVDSSDSFLMDFPGLQVVVLVGGLPGEIYWNVCYSSLVPVDRRAARMAERFIRWSWIARMVDTKVYNADKKSSRISFGRAPYSLRIWFRESVLFCFSLRPTFFRFSFFLFLSSIVPSRSVLYPLQALNFPSTLIFTDILLQNQFRYDYAL